MEDFLDKTPLNMRHVERKRVKGAMAKINKIISVISTKNILETNRLIREAGNCVSDMIGHKKGE